MGFPPQKALHSVCRIKTLFQNSSSKLGFPPSTGLQRSQITPQWGKPQFYGSCHFALISLPSLGTQVFNLSTGQAQQQCWLSPHCSAGLAHACWLGHSIFGLPAEIANKGWGFSQYGYFSTSNWKETISPLSHVRQATFQSSLTRTRFTIYYLYYGSIQKDSQDWSPLVSTWHKQKTLFASRSTDDCSRRVVYPPPLTIMPYSFLKPLPHPPTLLQGILLQNHLFQQTIKDLTFSFLLDCFLLLYLDNKHLGTGSTFC